MLRFLRRAFVVVPTHLFRAALNLDTVTFKDGFVVHKVLNTVNAPVRLNTLFVLREDNAKGIGTIAVIGLYRIHCNSKTFCTLGHVVILR